MCIDIPPNHAQILSLKIIVNRVLGCMQAKMIIGIKNNDNVS